MVEFFILPPKLENYKQQNKWCFIKVEMVLLKLLVIFVFCVFIIFVCTSVKHEGVRPYREVSRSKLKK